MTSTWYHLAIEEYNEKQKYHTFGTIQKYHTFGTIQKYHTVGTIQKYHSRNNS